MSGFRYRAFISYSHRDGHWARWLHRALESYRIPRKLVGTPGTRGEVPKRFVPVFRDREDLSSANDLSAKVREALAQSESLIVICSPAAAASRWVNEEIREFLRLGRATRIFCVIVDGDAAGGEAPCFPPALFDQDGEASIEPLAADARKWADGRVLAKLKLLAGMLGIPLDSLRRRDLQQRQRRWVTITVAAVAVALIATLAVTSRIAAEKRRAFAEDLVGFKLGELSGKLVSLPPGSETARLGEWGRAQRDEVLAAAGNTPQQWRASARTLAATGIERSRQGTFDAAMRDFRRSWALYAELHQRDPDDPDSLFDLGQAEFWIGKTHMDQGDLESAERSFMVYADISRRLVRARPDDSDRVLEMVYALSNLGNLERLKEPSDPDRALQFLQAALEYNQIALVLDPGSDLYRAELEQSHANLADAQLRVCDLGGALHSRMENTRLARDFHQAAPGDQRRKRLLAFALGGLANVQQAVGLSGLALDNLRESHKLLAELSALEPDDTQYRRTLIARSQRIAWLLAETGALEPALDMADALEKKWRDFITQAGSLDVRSTALHAEYLVQRAAVTYAAGRQAEGGELLRQAIAVLQETIRESPGLRGARDHLALAVYLQWDRHARAPEPGLGELLPRFDESGSARHSCTDASLAARHAVMNGDLAAAQRYTDYLLSKGYYEPGFIRFCRKHQLCREP